MTDIVKRLQIKAGVIQMGERIAWGSDFQLMYEAAEYIEQLEKQYEDLRTSFNRTQDVLYEAHAILADTPELNMQNFSDVDVHNLNEGATLAFKMINDYIEN